MSTFRITPGSLDIYKLTPIENLISALEITGDMNLTGDQLRLIADYISGNAGRQCDAMTAARLPGAFEAINAAHEKAGHLTADLDHARKKHMAELKELLDDCMEPKWARKVWATL